MIHRRYFCDALVNIIEALASVEMKWGGGGGGGERERRGGRPI